MRLGSGAILGACLAASCATMGAAWAHGTFHQRLERLNARLERNPNEVDLLLERAELYRDHGGTARALADLDRAGALEPDRSELDFLRGRILLDAGEVARAEAALSSFLQNHIDHPAAWAARARARVARGRFLEAAEDYDRAIAHQPVPLPEYYRERARALARVGDAHLEEAIRGLDEGLAALGPIVPLVLEAVEFEVRRGRIDAALARLDAVAVDSPRQEGWLVRRGEILESAGRLDEARASFERALAELETQPVHRRQTPAMVELETRLRGSLERLGPGER